MNSPILRLTNIHKSYAQGASTLPVLNGVSLAIHAGELVALIGPSGSGKSTLLQIAGLLDSPDSGEILIQGEAMQKAVDAKRTAIRNQKIGFIYQFHHLLPELTALENVTLPLLIAGITKAQANERAHALLSRLKLAERSAHLPAQLSGGEQQRVAIARALANRPALILADEPTGNLDPATSDSVCDLLLEIAAEQNIAALIATHNMALAKRLHRVLSMQAGRVSE
jgi:lipoprotein-releasing system ATP-binding protein